MINSLLLELQEKTQLEKIVIQEFFLSFEMKIPEYSNENVVVVFDDFEVENQRNQQFIMDSVDFIVNNFNLIKNEVFKSIVIYLNERYGVKKTTKLFTDLNVLLTTIEFSPATSFGTFKLYLNTVYEEEHGIGVLLEKLKVVGVGWGDIRFPKS